MEMEYAKMQILEMGLLILGAYLGGLVAQKLKIGEIVGQILGGMFVGPHFWEWVHNRLLTNTFLGNHPSLNFISNFYSQGGFQRYSQIFESYHFITFLFLGVIAFSLGEELHHERLRRVGIKATIICVFQGLVTFAFISVGIKLFFWHQFDWLDAFLIGSIGIATAPAITFIVMNKFKIEGPLKNILANIVVLDDIMEVIIFSIFLAIAQSKLAGAQDLTALGLGYKISRELLLSVVVAVGIFLVLKLAFRKRTAVEVQQDTNNSEERTFLSTVLFNTPTPSVEILLTIIGVVAIGIAFAIHIEAPFLISAVIAGYLIANYHHSSFFDSLKLDNVMTIFNLLFFGMIGVSININSFNRESLLYTSAYFLLRTLGKLIGNWSGAKLTHMDPKIVATLPKLMLPQAGMAAVEIVLVASVLKDGNGALIFNTILPALVAFELGGAYITEKTLEKWKNYSVGEKDAFDKAEVEHAGVMNINDILEQRVYQFAMTDKEEILHRLTEYAAVQNIITDVHDVYRWILEREELGHVSNASGLALPHIRLPYLDKVYVLCGLLKTPIKWNADDEYLVHTVFLLLTPQNHPNLHIKALQSIGYYCKHPDYRNILHEIMIAKKSVIQAVRQIRRVAC
jgi:Kef-type K+ transport system membrane component KefB/mannitol/fructose-specific phosphotransferase system IIA component (Ntr-type)